MYPTSLKWQRIEASNEGKPSYQVFHMHNLTVFIDTIISIKFHCNPPFCRCRNNCNFSFESTIGRCSGDHSKRPRNSPKNIWRPPSHVAGVPTPSSSFEFCGDWKWAQQSAPRHLGRVGEQMTSRWRLFPRLSPREGLLQLSRRINPFYFVKSEMKWDADIHVITSQDFDFPRLHPGE